jgi:hypothetical protein
MFTKPHATILSEQAGVIQMPRRAFPALAVQGDTLAVWRQRINDITRMARQTSDSDLIAECDRLDKQITGAFDTYNRICHEQTLGGF